METRDIPFFARMIVGLGPEAHLLEPQSIRNEIVRILAEMTALYVPREDMVGK